MDGDSARPIFSIRSAAEAPIHDHTLMSVAYRLEPDARVLPYKIPLTRNLVRRTITELAARAS